MRRRAVLAFGMLAAVSCGNFKSGMPDGGDAGATTDASSDATAQGTGPGPKGALPSGYCCTVDTECRARNCIDFNGSKMCADECKSQDPCDGGLAGFVCVGGSQFMAGRCEPSAATTKCVPASQFKYGTKKLGACCTPTWNGAAGTECEGGHCGQTGTGDFMCSNPCTKAQDCPGPFLCAAVADKYSLCIPLDAMQKCTM